MKDRSWGCLVTRTCLKNTVIDPMAIPERSQDVNLVFSKGTTRQAEAMPTPTIDQSVISKEGVDALNKLMLRKLAKESFLSEAPRKSGDSRDSHCHKKASTWEALREARTTIASCKCGSHSGKELISTFPYHHHNTMCMDTTKNYSASFEGGKVTEGVGSLLSRIGLDNRKKPESEMPVFQNLSRIDRGSRYKTIVSAQDFTYSIPSKDAGECQAAVSLSSPRNSLSISAEQVTSTSRTDLVNEYTEKNVSHGCEMPKHRFWKSELKAGKQRNKHVSWAMEMPVSKGSTGSSKNEDNDQELFYESGMTIGAHSPILGRKVDANEVITNLQAGNFKSSMHAVGHMCIREANSMADAKGSESCSSHRCSAGSHEGATASKSTLGCSLSTHDALDKLAPLENNFLKLNLNSPAHTEAASEAVTHQSSPPIAIPKEMQLRIHEAWNLLFEHEDKKHTDSSLVGRGFIRNFFRDEGEEETDSSKTSWPEGLKAAAYVHWNLRDLMQREEIEEDVEANLKALRTAHVPKQGHEKLDSRVEELARYLIEKKNDAKQENGIGGRGNPQRWGIAKSRNEDAQLDDVSRENSKTDPNATPRSQLIEERSIQGYPVLEEKTARKVHSSCPGDSGRDTDMDRKDDGNFPGKASSPDTKKLMKLQDSGGDSAAVRELVGDWGADRDDLEVLLEFLTKKQQLRDNEQSNVEVVVQTEAIVREILSRMKVDSGNSSSVDPETSVSIPPKFQIGERIVDDGHCEGGRKRREKSRYALSSGVINTSTERNMLEDSDTSQAVSVHQHQRVERFRRPPFVVPSSSKPYSFQRTTGSTSTRKSTSSARHGCDLSEEYRIATSPSRNPEEIKKCSRRSSGGARQPESRRSIQSVYRNMKHVPDVAAEGFASVASHNSKGGKSTVNGIESLDGTKGSAQLLENADNAGITLSNEFSALTSSPTEVPQGSPVMSLHSARNSESRTFAYNSPARTPLNYQREQQLPVPRASPVKRSTPKSPSSPHCRPCRGSPTRKSSPINRPSPLRSPRRQLKGRPATCQLESPRPTKILVADGMPHTLISKPTEDDNIFPTGISDAVVQQSVALAKDSSDPYADFCDSMLEMMQEKNLWQREGELQDLLQCFLHLNQPAHHQLIHQAFSDVVSFGSPMRYHQKIFRKERSKALLRHGSSPSMSPSRQVWDVSQTKSPARGGG